MDKNNEPDNVSTNEKIVFLFSLATFFYFSGLMIINFFKIDWVILGVFIEMLTIPFLLVLIVLIPTSISLLIKKKKKTWTLPLYSILFLLTTTVLMILNL